LVQKFPKDFDVFAQMVSSRNTCSRGFASSRNQEGVSEITREKWNTNNIQKRRATFYIRINTKKNSASI